jgi:hypothetical protein
MIPGMDMVEQVAENIAALTPWRPLNTQERDMLLKDMEEIGQNFCRRCGYCLPCPAGIDIPTVFILNLQYTRYGVQAAKIRYESLTAKAEECKECGACEQRCPYNLPIREKLKNTSTEMGC